MAVNFKADGCLVANSDRVWSAKRGTKDSKRRFIIYNPNGVRCVQNLIKSVGALECKRSQIQFADGILKWTPEIGPVAREL